MSKAKTLSINLADRLRTITKAQGYATDIGAQVFRGRRKIDNVTACTTIYEANDKVVDDVNPPVVQKSNTTPGQSLIKQRYYIEGVASCDADNPNDAAHDILADIKRALWTGDRSFGGIARTISYVGRGISQREDGQNVVAAHVIIDLEFMEILSDP